MFKYLAEFLGTFIFLSVILRATSPTAVWPNLAPILIAVGLLAGIVFSAGSSGGHLNPAVSVMMAFDNKLPLADLAQYIVAQLLGGLAAKLVFDIELNPK
jgi:glycerol uptake facilitator-like aquaporin